MDAGADGCSPGVRKCEPFSGSGQIYPELNAHICINPCQYVIQHDPRAPGNCSLDPADRGRLEDIKGPEQYKCRNKITGAFGDEQDRHQITAQFVYDNMAAVLAEDLFSRVRRPYAEHKQRQKGYQQGRVRRSAHHYDKQTRKRAECARGTRQMPDEPEGRDVSG